MDRRGVPYPELLSATGAVAAEAPYLSTGASLGCKSTDSDVDSSTDSTRKLPEFGYTLERSTGLRPADGGERLPNQGCRPGIGRLRPPFAVLN